MSEAQRRRERALLQYHLAVEAGDLDTACRILAEAEGDPILQRQILEMEDALAEEQAEEAARARDQDIVRDLLGQYLSTEPDAPPPPLTVGRVVSRMQADGQIGAQDRHAARNLQTSTASLPARPTALTVRALLVRLGADTSDRFQRLFRETAVLLGLAASQEQAAYARRAKTPKDQDPPGKEEPSDDGGGKP